MQYISTRGEAPSLTFDQALLTGLASDGGLYVPAELPTFSMAEISAMRQLPYTALAQRILTPFVEDAFDEKSLRALIEKSYQSFRHQAIAPLTQISQRHFILELFHGPTLAFKDFALQLVGNMMEALLEKQQADSSSKPAIVLGATSGDTGSAAIAGLQGKKGLSIVILYPKGRPSEVQRRQMTTVTDDNVHAIAIDGTFDDCQDIVKALFADQVFRKDHQLLAVNSINIARVLAQIIYYFYAALHLGAPAAKPSFVVPTGNFGDIFAGYLAKKMGLPINRLIIATNENDILARAVKMGEYKITGVSQTLSPSMDIQIASNFERLLFDYYGRDGAALKQAMLDLRTAKTLPFPADIHRDFTADFDAHRIDDTATMAIIQRVYHDAGYLLDPHSAVGVGAGEAFLKQDRSGGPVITLATAHAAKFPEAVKQATNITPALPESSKSIMTEKERIIDMPGELNAVKHYLEVL